MSEEGEIWKEHKRAQQQRRAERLPRRTAELMELTREGFNVKRLTEFQFRVNGVLDIYPIHHRYHDIKGNRRGGFPNIKKFVRQFFERKNISDRSIPKKICEGQTARSYEAREGDENLRGPEVGHREFLKQS